MCSDINQFVVSSCLKQQAVLCMNTVCVVFLNIAAMVLLSIWHLRLHLE